MSDPVIVERAAHSVSRSQIDPDALKVLYRLHQNNHIAYLVGGSVRDLLLGRRPKDFDIGTSAHPYQVKRLFKNCWVIGRRFRLAHVRFGSKTIEVATFRRKVTAEELAAAEEALATEQPEAPENGRPDPERLVHRENTFGTPEEDAFRRDFTINALFYDIGTFAVIDYTGGLEDLRTGLVRSIGDPAERFHEDPVRMLRAIAMAARLGFTIDDPIESAIADHRAEIARSAPARLIEEFYKLLRSGAAEQAFRMMAERKLLEPIAHDLQKGADERLWRSLAALDAYRRRYDETPDALTNAVLLGSLLVPLGMTDHPRHSGKTRHRVRDGMTRHPAHDGMTRHPVRDGMTRHPVHDGMTRHPVHDGMTRHPVDDGMTRHPVDDGMTRHPVHDGMTRHPVHDEMTELEKEPRLSLGMLPLARRDVERFRQVLGLQRRLLDPRLSPRARRALMHRGPFREALAWLEIHGETPEAVEHWRGFIEASGLSDREHEGAEDLPPPRRRRRRRRRSFRPATN